MTTKITQSELEQFRSLQAKVRAARLAKMSPSQLAEAATKRKAYNAKHLAEVKADPVKNEARLVRQRAYHQKRNADLKEFRTWKANQTA